jgi:drug/metabolite transporter (DMT)-like permease
MQRKDHLDAFAIGLLIACCAFWGFQQVLVKATLADLPPVFQAGVRFAGTTVVLWLWCRWRGIALWERDGSLRPGLLAGFLFSMEFFCLFNGLQFSAASRLTVFLYTSPLWAALVLHWFVPSERLRAVQWLGLVFAFGAVAFTLRDGFVGAQTATQHWGDLLGIGGGIAWALTTVVIRTTVLSTVGAEKMLFYQVACSALVLPLLSYELGEHWSWPWEFSAFALGSLALQTVVGAFASYLSWMWLLSRYPANKIGAFAFSTPLFALFFGSLWLGEQITLSLLGALAMVGVGISLVNRRKPAQIPASQTEQ